MDVNKFNKKSNTLSPVIGAFFCLPGGRFLVSNEVKGKEKRIFHAFRKIVFALSVASLYSLCA